MLSKPLQLLMIEDSPRDAELSLLTLERAGLLIESTLVFNHQGAEQALRTQVFDLILCDFLLPGSSGAEVLQRAREIAPHTPFIFLSGVFGEENAVEMMRLGAIDYVLKQNLTLLPKAVKRALAEVDERRQRVRAEENLEQVEVRARLAIDAARMGVWDFSPATGQLLWDERCRALYGVAESTAISIDYFLDHCHPDDRALVEAKMAQAMSPQGNVGYQAEYRALLPGGGERWLATSGRAFFEGLVCVRFTGVIQDITEQKLATEALHRLNELLGDQVQKRTRERDRTWELSRELLAVMRFDMSPIALNPAWEATLGWSRQTLGQMQLWELVHPNDIGATVRETENIASGNVSTRFVNRMRHADGDYRWLSWTIVPDENLMYAAVRDITGERAVVDELAATNEQLREQIKERERIEATLQQMQRLEAVGQLTAGVAHDFNNLLTVILTSASFLSRDIERGVMEKVHSRLHNIREAGERGAKLTGQLLAFSRRQRLEPIPVNLNDTVFGMFELLQRTLGGSIWIQTHTDEGLWSALVDPTQTEMIILNLAINARDAMPAGGTLRLATRNEVVERPAQHPQDPEPGAYVVLSIGDTGSGMNAAVLAKAFEPFFTTKDIGKGSGLGLAQVFGFAKQSGGGVGIVTAPGQGTTVDVYLPSFDSCPAQPSAPVAERVEPTTCGGDRTVLLVDDDHQVRAVTAHVLERLGYRVLEAASGQVALDILSEQVDVLLTDYAMPGMNGAQLAQVARGIYPQLPVVFITGYAEMGGLQGDEALVVQKPYRDDELASKLEQALFPVRNLEGSQPSP
ncbi:PAS/PAC sensor hybrid histidine kinase [Pseudomonas sp. M47T1]|uniref:hybrid sensor histidine kinase/response regulator n=1 Tax=unclassified Pseudomonas TaxID=196821 RepID=UPI0002608303|nr:hybrid sensor histidine kinase/response regulator [Pseudomonas sp. M47T1]EIK96003.1 PAS/PAC sensor hybrid histidine kinase [Pseudomonas sp. M47T1]